MLSWLTQNRIGTWLHTRRFGELVGQDDSGNRYYRQPGVDGGRERRWVVYATQGEIEASAVPPGWHAWLNHNLAVPPSPETLPTKPWEKPHQPNLTGTTIVHLPAGHELRGGQRQKATGDYEAWQPE
ncbi:MAG: NADH:ubiquinone oxidoreductase subunit NDUFA12 [Geminicoccaceae bacterium]